MKMLYKVTVQCGCYGHEVVKDSEDGEDGEDGTFAGVRLLRYWQIELMDGREVGSLCQQLFIISQSPGA